LDEKFANVILWRNKVAAHTAWEWAREEDNAVTRDMSIVLFPAFNFMGDGHFEVGGVRPISEKGESCPEWQWKLVPTHQRLREIVSKYAAAK
jgi:hypothetical protein